jgi:hypothetical protein
VEHGREGSVTAILGGIYLDSTLRRLSEVVDALRSGEPVGLLRAPPFAGYEPGGSHRAGTIGRELSRVDELFRLSSVAPQLAASHEDLRGRATVVPLGARAERQAEPVPVYWLVSVTG